MRRSRRDFLQISGLSLGALGLPISTDAQSGSERISIIVDPADPVSSATPCRWALNELTGALEKHGIKVAEYTTLGGTPTTSDCLLVCGDRQPAAGLLRGAGLALSNDPESLALVPFLKEKRHGILACGGVRGLMYALLELADRVRHSDNPLSAFEQPQAISERPFNSIRSCGRIFCSDIQDRPWFNDREMWPAYFSMLATQRFNRFSLNLGIGYDFLDTVRDAYFLFAYPFLLPVPGYNVRAINLPDEERDRNLEMLRFISSQAVAHGIDFQLGIWTHGYKWGPASQPNYTIEGISSDNHAAYSRDALTGLLKACPDVSGVTLRTHGESGVREGSYSFWSAVFSALPASGRKVNLDLHTKGLDQNLIDAALQTGMPVTLSPKYWAEHMGLPYQQASIRELEMPHENGNQPGFFALSAGSRSFTRYGYADFLREDRRYGVMFRIWPGSHRLLLWGSPASAAAHARAFNFCGCNGVELFEPLSFKGRRGSGIPGSRCAYADTSLNPRWDWQKYRYTYRTWGRLMYNPDTHADVWQRYLRKQFGPAAPGMEAALSSASPIAEIITTAHLPSAANEGFSPEYYTNQSIVDASKPSPYNDTPAPKVFGNVSPLDPLLFSTINEFVAGLSDKERSGKCSPLQVAQWLASAADIADAHLAHAVAHIADKNSAEYRRAALDLQIEIGIGRFFAAKLRSGVLYAAFERTGDRPALEEAIQEYRRARDIWQKFAKQAKGVYVSDISFGPSPHQRGNWLDRLTAIDDDIAEMQKQIEGRSRAGAGSAAISPGDLTSPGPRESWELQHNPPPSFTPGQSLEIRVSVPAGVLQPLQIRLWYRHVNQAERWRSAEMDSQGGPFASTIPADYTKSVYPLQYFFELRRAADDAWLFPGLKYHPQIQFYFVVRATTARSADTQ